MHRRGFLAQQLPDHARPLHEEIEHVVQSEESDELTVLAHDRQTSRAREGATKPESIL